MKDLSFRNSERIKYVMETAFEKETGIKSHYKAKMHVGGTFSECVVLPPCENYVEWLIGIIREQKLKIKNNQK